MAPAPTTAVHGHWPGDEAAKKPRCVRHGENISPERGDQDSPAPSAQHARAGNGEITSRGCASPKRGLERLRAKRDARSRSIVPPAQTSTGRARPHPGAGAVSETCATTRAPLNSEGEQEGRTGHPCKKGQSWCNSRSKIPTSRTPKTTVEKWSLGQLCVEQTSVFNFPELVQLPLQTHRSVASGIRPRIGVGATLICAHANVNGRDDADRRNCTLGSKSA